MTSQEYVYILPLGLATGKLIGPQPWGYNDGFDNLVRSAYRQLLMVSDAMKSDYLFAWLCLSIIFIQR